MASYGDADRNDKEEEVMRNGRVQASESTGAGSVCRGTTEGKSRRQVELQPLSQVDTSDRNLLSRLRGNQILIGTFA